MRKKIEAGKKFLEDLETDRAEEEMIKVIRMVYVYQREERDIISEARNEEHIIDQ